MPIEELDLSTRSYNCLKRSNITKVGQVLAMNEDDLLSVRNFGRKSLDELYDRLRVRGLMDKDHPANQAADGAAS
ncbi:MAG TPA: DNA-directed RNA polymerase subunit alpha C-terminal domain-containing protein, partial [Chloroflexota bacterium]|jgi:DNA-directed RNA polymerase subunit alpha|nr:DNA-directed RNA polymerase subunit alpha C-terminal domain-containing protein [Chloroflexota bacterium]